MLRGRSRGSPGGTVRNTIASDAYNTYLHDGEKDKQASHDSHISPREDVTQSVPFILEGSVGTKEVGLARRDRFAMPGSR